MDLQGIIDRLLPMLSVALIIGLAAIGASYGAYALYRKRGGTRKIAVGSFAAGFLLLAWFAVVMALTAFSRGANYGGWFNFRLFSGYASAWHQWSLSEWQLIVFNMLMFAPLGFLLPLLARGMRRFLPVLLASFAVTLGIELFQMVTRRGIFELDDLLHNTIGSMAGYLLMRAALDIAERRKLTFKPIAKAAAIPLAFALLFGGAMLVYHAKEYGNLAIRPAIKQDMSRVEVVLNAALPNAAEPVALYRSDRIHNLAYAESIAELLARSFELRQQGGVRIDGPNRIWLLTDDAGNSYTYNYSVRSGEWWMSSDRAEREPMAPATLADRRADYERWLTENGLLPADAAFSTQHDDTLRWDAPRAAEDIARGDADYTAGIIMLVPPAEGSAPAELNYFMKPNAYVGKVERISPAAAYKEVLKGNFDIYNDLKPGNRLQIDEYEADYVYDSKGYYQPIYRFVGSVDGEPWEALIPALA